MKTELLVLSTHRAPENLKLAGNWPKMAAMCGLQDYQKGHIFVVFKLIIPITVDFMHLFWAFRPLWLAFSISGSSFRLVDTHFWSYFSWLAKSGCQNLKLAGNTFPPFPSFWSPVHTVHLFKGLNINSAHWRHWMSGRVQIVGQINFLKWMGVMCHLSPVTCYYHIVFYHEWHLDSNWD